MIHVVPFMVDAQPVIDDLSTLTEQIDEESRAVLDPENATPSESPEE